jgi:hypothetical protein
MRLELDSNGAGGNLDARMGSKSWRCGTTNYWSVYSAGGFVGEGSLGGFVAIGGNEPHEPPRVRFGVLPWTYGRVR